MDPKQILLSFLVDAIGKYVDGLKDAKIGLLAGAVEFNNLEVKPSALQELDLPVTIVRGALRYLKVIIPWQSLGSSPIQVTVDGLYVQAEPFDYEKVSNEERGKNIEEFKKNILKKAENAAVRGYAKTYFQYQEPDDQSKSNNAKASFISQGYLEKLFLNLIANLELKVTNIHIKYVDSKSVPGVIVGAGVTLESIVIATTDDDWVEIKDGM